jgi:hypothetical protein
VSLVETRGRYLRGYGEVPRELAEYLDRRVGELESRVNEIRRLVEAGAKDESSGSPGSAASDLSETPSRAAGATRVTDGLDELHERRLATLMNVFDDALDRIELVLATSQQGRAGDAEPPPTDDEAGEFRVVAANIHRRIEAAVLRFGVNRARPGWRQKIAAELSTLWVVLENAMPKRMKGYGREFKPQDQVDWEHLIRDLLRDIDRMRKAGSSRTDAV